ncbi:hypothetical protein GCM10027051_27320 [Niabella terrae]
MAISVATRHIEDVHWEQALPPACSSQVLLFSLDPTQVKATQEALESLLDEPEKRKSLSFRQTADRQRYLVARAGLKQLLANYGGVAAREVKLGVEANGKPYWDQPGVPRFNISHSGSQVLIAVGPQDMGVDVEEVRPLEIREMLQVFSAAEQRYILATADTERFFRLWTRKEALLKALGTGLVDELSSFNLMDGSHHFSYQHYCGSYDIMSLKSPDALHAIAVCVPTGNPVVYVRPDPAQLFSF